MKPPHRKPPFIQTAFVSQAPAKEAPVNPPGFALWALLALIIWPIGIVGAVVYLCDPKHRGAGLALFVIALASGIVGWLLIYGRFLTP